MTLSSLQQARSIARPSREQMLNREFSVQQFWNQNRDLFERAWSEWQTENEAKLPQLDSSIFDPKLRAAVEQAWVDPTAEGAVKDLWEEVFPGVYRAQFFDVERLAGPCTRNELECVAVKLVHRLEQRATLNRLVDSVQLPVQIAT